LLISPVALFAAHVDTHSPPPPRTKITESAKARRRISRLRQKSAPDSLQKSSQSHTARRHRHHYRERFYTSSYATDTLNGDITKAKTRRSVRQPSMRSAT